MKDRPEALRRVAPPAASRRLTDPQGKRSLFSEEIIPPPVGSVALHCPRCDSRSVVSVVQAAKLATPMLYIPTPGRTNTVWMKCPACQSRGWLKVRFKA